MSKARLHLVLNSLVWQKGVPAWDRGVELDKVFFNSRWVLIGGNSIPYQCGHQKEMQHSAMMGPRQIFAK